MNRLYPFRHLQCGTKALYNGLPQLLGAAFVGALFLGLVSCQPYKVKSPAITAQVPPKNIPLESQRKDLLGLPGPGWPHSKNNLALDPDLAKTWINLKAPKNMARQMRVGLLLPLSGPSAPLGKALMEAAFLAMFDVADDRFVFLPRDTMGTPGGAVLAAQDAIESGAKLLIGPVFGKSARAVAPVASKASVNLISFTNDQTVASDVTFVFGFLPEDRLRRVVGYAASKGITRFGALIPKGKFGDQILIDYKRVIKNVGGVFVRSERYDRNTVSLTGAIKRLGRYEFRKAALISKRKSLASRDDSLSQNILKKLEQKTVLGSPPFDAVFLLETGKSLKAIASLLSYYEVNRRQARVIGINNWSARSIVREPSLFGAWYAGPSPQLFSEFSKRFVSVFENKPHELASLAYDATALVALKAKEGPMGFSLNKLTAENGFYGSAGLFRLRVGGLVQHIFSVMEVQPDGARVVSPSPRSFNSSLENYE